MQEVNQLLLEVRDVGESVVSTCRDLEQLLLVKNGEVEHLQKLKHSKVLVESILSMIGYLSNLDLSIIDRHKELSEEVRKLHLSCSDLQSVLSQESNGVGANPLLANVHTFLRNLYNSANRIITISLLAKPSSTCTSSSVSGDEENICYKHKEECRRNCQEGDCYEEACQEEESNKQFSCPEYTEVFTESPLVHVENGYVENEQFDWMKLSLLQKYAQNVIKETGPNSRNIYSYTDIDEKANKVNTIDNDITNDIHYTITSNKNSNDNIQQDLHTKGKPDNFNDLVHNFINGIIHGNKGIYSSSKDNFDDSISNDVNNNNDKSDIGPSISQNGEKNGIDYPNNESPVNLYERTTHSFYLLQPTGNTITTNYVTRKDLTEEPTTPNYDTTTETSENISNLYHSASPTEYPQSSSYETPTETLQPTYYTLSAVAVEESSPSSYAVNNETIEITSGYIGSDTKEEHSNNQKTIEPFETTTTIDYSSNTNHESATTIDDTITETPEITASGFSTCTTEEHSNNEVTTEPPETTTTSYYSSYTTEDTTTMYHTTTETAETTTTSYYSAYTTEEPTTSSYETTTEDLYKISQDIYSVAQDLSTKANEISSMTSDISSKVSDINSMVSDLNSYDDDELSKKVQSVSKLTQEINSKTSEISSLCSTTSSLASDISSASSDMTTADRHHRLRTTPWQKMASKSQDMITSTQAIITAAQDILVKVDSVVNIAADLKVGDAVSTAGYEVNAKIQLVISETLNIVSAVIELMNVVDS